MSTARRPGPQGCFGGHVVPTGKEVTQARLRKYQQLTFEIRERGPGFAMEVVPVVFG